MRNSGLYIVGNGFDLHHRIASSYCSSFRPFVREHNRQVYDVAMKHIFQEDQNLWQCFEGQLASLDVDQLLDEHSNLLQSYDAADWRDSGHHDNNYEIDHVLEALSAGLHSAFCQWIRSVKVPSREQACGQLLNICSESRFLSFNYTNTLERVYGVHQDEILYIHGRAESGPNSSNQIIIGHRGGKHSFSGDVSFDAADTRIVEGNVSIDNYFTETSKPVNQIIQRESLFFNGLSEISEIVVLGHSFGEVDLPYFKQIARKCRPDANWSASVYSDKDLSQVAGASQFLFNKSDEMRTFQLNEKLLDRQ